MNSATPICRTFVIKIASRCNLNCTYCYMYNMGDSTYKLQPKFMSEKTYIAMFKRAKEHCIEHHINNFSFVIHGGEPLLTGKKYFEKFVETGREIFSDSGVNTLFTLQTNALLLDDEWCEIFQKYGIKVGISLDGLQKDNDKNRIDHAGRGSYDAIVRGVKLLNTKAPDVRPGILTVININSDPTEIYDHFKKINIKAVDFLIPEATYNQKPPRPVEGKFMFSETPYADWLIEMFDNWFNDNTGDRLYVRRFKQYIHSIMGGDVNGDDMGNLHNEVLVVETNGAFEAVDALKVCGEGFTKNKTNVKDCKIDEALRTDLAAQYYYSHFNLPKKCLACPINETCGGGYIPHRYSTINGFNNPSVYCNDLMKLITHIQALHLLSKLLVDVILIANIAICITWTINPFSFSLN